MPTVVTRFLLALVPVLGVACAPVTQTQKRHLADPTMTAVVDPLEGAAQRKLTVSREGAAGGDSQSAGGGCSCGN